MHFMQIAGYYSILCSLAQVVRNAVTLKQVYENAKAVLTNSGDKSAFLTFCVSVELHSYATGHNGKSLGRAAARTGTDTDTESSEARTTTAGC